MNEKEKEIKELEDEIRTLCMEVYGRNGDELIDLIEKANSVYTSGIMFTDERDTIALCRLFRKIINKDKEKYGVVTAREYYPYCTRCICGGEARLKYNEYEMIQIEPDNPPVRYICELCGREFGLVFY